ncbi:MAG: hypothetical protein GIKADHBN_02070 [Phycisphaerales bacterium]|nr:hypothetical protein [Phycisphaerales bacterium]
MPGTNVRLFRRLLAGVVAGGLACVALGQGAAAPAAPADEPAANAPGTTAPFLPATDAPLLACSDRWPVRAFRTAGDIQGAIVPWDVKVSWLLPRFTRMTDPGPTELDLADARALDADEQSEVVLEGPHSVVFREGTAEEAQDKGFGWGPGRAAGPDASLVFRFVSGTQRHAGNTGGTPRLQIQRTWFAYYDPVAPRRRRNRESNDAPAEAPKARGIVLVMPGLYGTPEPTIDALIRRLRESEMGVLRMLAQPSRFTERVSIEIDPENLEESAARIADILGDRAAECGLAAQAAWKYLEDQRPDLAALPRAIIGTSAGAMTLPTVVAREPEKYSACVLVGGAADFWLIARRSSYKRDASSIDIQVKGFDTPPGEDDGAIDWRAFDQMYLDQAVFDSFHTAGSLRGGRVLVLHGQMDTAVPAPLGEVLWERLGRPERWEYPTGHEGLIVEMLPRDTGKIIEWLRESGLR